MAFGGFEGGGRRSTPMADINVIPLVDIMLVLLVIFIVTAPLLTHSVKIDLPKATSTPDESRELNARHGPMVIVAGSGMATGGRVIHHLKAFAPEKRNTVLLAGFQAGGTRGAALLAGAPTIRIHGEDVPVRCRVEHTDSLSAHADAGEIEAWLRGMPKAPRTVFVTHGEPAASDALRFRIEHELGWRVTVPEHRDVYDLSANELET